MTTPDPNVPAEPNRPKDTRPRPQYGELAPEGWSWTPQDQAVEPVAPNEPTLPNVPVASAGHPTARTGAPAWDRPVTLGLLVFGLLATFVLISVLGALPEAMQVLYTQENLGTYNPAASV